MRKTAKIMLTTIPAKTIMSNTFELLLILRPHYLSEREDSINTQLEVCQANDGRSPAVGLMPYTEE